MKRNKSKSVAPTGAKKQATTRALPKVPRPHSTARTSFPIVTNPPPRSPPPDWHQGISSGSLSSHKMTSGVDGLGEFLEVAGHEFISTVTLGSTTPNVGDTIFSRMNTVAPNHTRLKQFAQCYHRWHPMVYQYEFTSAQSTSASGQLAFCVDPDPVFDWSTVSGDAAISRCLAMGGADVKQLWENACAYLPRTSDYTSLWCMPATSADHDPEDRTSVAGSFNVVVISPPSFTAGLVLGTIVLRYRIRLYLPKVPDNSLGATLEFAVPGNKVIENKDQKVNVIGRILKTIKDVATSVPTGTGDQVIAAIKSARVWADLISDEKSEEKLSDIDNGVYGLPSGAYSIDIVYATSDTDEFAALWDGADVGMSSNNAGFNGVTGFALNTANPFYVGLDGVAYPFSWMCSYEFSVRNTGVSLRPASRGYLDLWLRVPTSAALPDLTGKFFVTIRSTAAPTYIFTTLTSPGVLKPKITMSPDEVEMGKMTIASAPRSLHKAKGEPSDPIRRDNYVKLSSPASGPGLRSPPAPR